MTKVKNKNESITFFRGIYRIMKVFQNRILKDLLIISLSLLTNLMRSILTSKDYSYFPCWASFGMSFGNTLFLISCTTK